MKKSQNIMSMIVNQDDVMIQKASLWMEAVHGNPFHITRDFRIQKVYQRKSLSYRKKI